jgi:integrase
MRPEMINDGRLKYRMMKNQKIVSIQLPPPAREIVAYWEQAHSGLYLFPYLQKGDEDDYVHVRERISRWNVTANSNLKDLAERAGIDDPDDVTTHVARHSFSDIARQKTDDIYAISKALAHSDIATTERYLAGFDADAVDNLTDTMWSDD